MIQEFINYPDFVSCNNSHFTIIEGRKLQSNVKKQINEWENVLYN